MSTSTTAWSARIDALGSSHSRLVVLDERGRVESRCWAEVAAAAERLARSPALAGGRGPVLFVGQPTVGQVAGLLACWSLGRPVCMAPTRTRLQSRAAHEDDVVERRDLVGAGTVLVAPRPDESEGVEVAAAAGRGRGGPIDLGDGLAARPGSSEGRLTEGAVVQLTSGSTGAPQPLLLGEDVLASNLAGAQERLDLGADEVVVSWLPLHHDMGFVGSLCLGMWLGATTVLAQPSWVVRRPTRWLDLLSTWRGTITSAPSFANRLVARAAARGGGPWDLGTLRALVTGAEPIDVGDAAALGRLVEAHGGRAGVVTAAYGMAETAVATCIADLGSGGRGLLVDPDVLDHEGRLVAGPSGRSMALVGRPIAGLDVSVRDEAGDVAAEGQVGEVRVRGSSVAADLSGTALDQGGWYRTGDHGAMWGSELVVCGRISETIIVQGRTLAPQPLERAAEGVPGVRPGGVSAIGVPGPAGTEQVVVLAEIESEHPPGEVRSAVARRVQDRVGVAPSEVVLLEPRRLARTTSGKLRRREHRRAFLAGQLASSEQVVDERASDERSSDARAPADGGAGEVAAPS